MKYQGLGPPNPYDSASLAALRKQRDPAYYAMWKDDVLKTIKAPAASVCPGGRGSSAIAAKLLRVPGVQRRRS